MFFPMFPLRSFLVNCAVAFHGFPIKSTMFQQPRDTSERRQDSEVQSLMKEFRVSQGLNRARRLTGNDSHRCFSFITCHRIGRGTLKEKLTPTGGWRHAAASRAVRVWCAFLLRWKISDKRLHAAYVGCHLHEIARRTSRCCRVSTM